MGANFVGRYQPVPHQISDRCVIDSQAGGLLVTDEIGAAITNMRQVQGIVNDVCSGQCSPHTAGAQPFSRLINAQVGRFNTAP